MAVRTGLSTHLRRAGIAAFTAIAAFALTACGTTTIVVTASPEVAPELSAVPSPSASPSPIAEANADDAGSETATGNSGSGSGSGSGSASGGDAPPPAPAAEPAPEPAPEAPAGPTLAMYDQRCNSGKLIVVVTANAGSGSKKGVQSVVMERQNDYGAWLDYTAQWRGPDTGQGNEWTATINHLDGDDLRITAKASSGGGETVITAPVTVNC